MHKRKKSDYDYMDRNRGKEKYVSETSLLRSRDEGECSVSSRREENIICEKLRGHGSSLGEAGTRSRNVDSFELWKRDLDEVLSKCSITEKDEFWKFARSYTCVQKKAQNKNETPHVKKTDCIPITLNTPIDKLYSRLNTGASFTLPKFKEFCEVICLYLDFKQKEKFAKLMKLRECQKNLPITQYKQEIITAVQENRVVIVAGDTGCGKSTQVPQYLLNAGFKCIACTQPRRIACIALCKRVSYETLDRYGRDVGYQIRFEKSRSQDTRILFITEGLLLRQVATDSLLSSYDVIVMDEAHERHLHGDFLLGVLKCLLHQRSDLKLVLMSATINIELFQRFFAKEDPAIIQVPGRLHPIKLKYCPISKEDQPSRGERFNAAPYIRVLQLIDDKYPKDERGDVLMFLSGMSEISAVVEAAQEYASITQGWVVLPLHSALSLGDQDKVFDYPPEGYRKCVVATNIAETSITIDGIRFVVDSGKMKQMSYDAGTRMQRLKEFWVSQANAEQRKDAGLLTEDQSSTAPATPAERAMHHGEMQLLRKLRREQRAAGPRKRRRLRADTWQLATGEDEEEPDHDADVRDVEFRLSHSGSQLQNLLSGASANSSDLGLLKLLVVSGLYPQLAVADEFNASKSVSEMLFHTTTKPFVALHPMSYFGRHPQVLQLSDADVEAPARSQGRLPYSSRHQLICYMSLLETTKPYLMNTLRTPAAQTLLLFSQSIDTNLDFSRIVCDEWLELEFSAPPAAAVLLRRVSHLRMMWARLLSLKLEVVSRHQKQDTEEEPQEGESKLDKAAPAEVDAEAADLSLHLASELPRLLHVQISYSIARLLAADRKVLFVGPGVNNQHIEPNPFVPTQALGTPFCAEPHPRKGGVRVTPFLTYGCLEETTEEPAPLEEWHCEYCEFVGLLQPLQQLQHMEMCQPVKEETKETEHSEEREVTQRNTERHQCPICKKLLQMSATELLRHRRRCSASMSEESSQKEKR